MRVRVDGAGTIYTATSLPPVWLLYAAFQVKDHQQVSGYPKWVDSEAYDLVGKLPKIQSASHCLDDSSGEAAALQELLAERFALKYHVIQRSLPVYGLSVSKAGAKLKLDHPSPDYLVKYPDGKYWFIPPAKARLEYGSIDKLCNILTSIIGRPVVDHTGLSGHYDFELTWDTWTPPGGWSAGSQPTRGTREDESTGPSIFSAVQEQLGLKLTKETMMAPFIVIDHIERPSPN